MATKPSDRRFIHPLSCAICGETFNRQYDWVRHERELHLGEKEFVCKGELKQDGQWGCGRHFARAVALGRHFCSEAGRICIEPLLAEEAIECQRRWQEEQRTEHHMPKKQEPVSAFPVDESGKHTIPAALVAQYPALAYLNWSKLATVDDGYDNGPGKPFSFDASRAEYYSGVGVCYTGLRPSMMKEILQAQIAANLSGEPVELNTNTVLEGDCAAKISEKPEPKDSTDNNIEPLALPEVKEEDQLVLDNEASFSSSAVSSKDEIDIKPKPLSDSAKTCINVLTKVSEQAEEPARESNPTNKNRRTERLPCNEVPGDYDHLSAASTTESGCEGNESSEAETISSEASSGSSFISPVLEAYNREAVEGLMIEFKVLLDHSLGVQSRVTSRGSSNSSSPPPSSAEQPSQQGVSSRGKRKESDGNGSKSSRDDGDDDQYKKARVEGSSQDLSPRKFACPYYRRNSQKHKKHRSCAGPGWISVRRVKEHVFRQHCLPIYCHRCYTIFKNESDLAAHQRLLQGCEVKVVELLEGCGKEQEKLLRKRKRGLGSEEDKWKDMFKNLFPDDNEDMIPTPYYDDEQDDAWESRRDDDFTQYEQYLSQELPRAVRRQLEQAVFESAKPFEGELKSQLVDIVRDAQSALFRSYRQTNMPRSSSVLPEQEESEADQAQTDSLNAQEPLPTFDFSAFFAPPPLADSYSDSVGGDISASLLGGPVRNYQLTSRLGYGSNNVSSNFNGVRFGAYDFGTNGDFPNLSNGETAPPPTSQGSYQNWIGGFND